MVDCQWNKRGLKRNQDNLWIILSHRFDEDHGSNGDQFMFQSLIQFYPKVSLHITRLSICVLVTKATVRAVRDNERVRVRRPIKYLVLWVRDTWGLN